MAILSEPQQRIVDLLQLHSGSFLTAYTNPNGTNMYRLIDAALNPIENFRAASVAYLIAADILIVIDGKFYLSPNYVTNEISKANG